jgi:hypothetical protein
LRNKKLTLGVGLPTHDLVAKSPACPLERLESAIPVTNGRPQRLDLLAGIRESLVPLLDGSTQHRNLVLQGPEASGHLPDLDVEGVTMPTDKGDVLLELFHPC